MNDKDENTDQNQGIMVIPHLKKKKQVVCSVTDQECLFYKYLISLQVSYLIIMILQVSYTIIKCYKLLLQ